MSASPGALRQGGQSRYGRDNPAKSDFDQTVLFLEAGGAIHAMLHRTSNHMRAVVSARSAKAAG